MVFPPSFICCFLIRDDEVFYLLIKLIFILISYFCLVFFLLTF